ncbi:MAG: hypothetical protein JO154_12365 [Chitinophaga sp.]|uniref:hypothetical protein n=1 Tax=Chitinophaga sp. TaxID=1869181 RepID=UPI0025C5D85F|nr:hypothetical protein [Chitinophaga sp.]MBV8253394.1 hypothetical protein [Chitinophaga sp.]
MNIGEKLNRTGDKILYFYDYGRKSGQRPSTGIFTYVNPKNQEQKNFNKEALKILETKKAQRIIEEQSIGTPIIPAHKFKVNFLDYNHIMVYRFRRSVYICHEIHKLQHFLILIFKFIFI